MRSTEPLSAGGNHQDSMLGDMDTFPSTSSPTRELQSPMDNSGMEVDVDMEEGADVNVQMDIDDAHSDIIQDEQQKNDAHLLLTGDDLDLDELVKQCVHSAAAMLTDQERLRDRKVDRVHILQQLLDGLSKHPGMHDVINTCKSS